MDVLFFHGRYCPPCKSTGKAVERWAQENGVSFYSFDVQDVYGGFSQRQAGEVKHVPCAVLVNDGAEVARCEGGADAQRIADAFSPYVNAKDKGKEVER